MVVFVSIPYGREKYDIKRFGEQIMLTRRTKYLINIRVRISSNDNLFGTYIKTHF